MSLLIQESRHSKVEEILRIIEGYTVEELREEVATYSPKKVLELWNLLKPTFQAMCWRFGKMSPSRRARAYRLHQQIRRLSVIQEMARRVET